MNKSELKGQVTKVSTHAQGGWTITLNITELDHVGMDQSDQVKACLDLVRKNAAIAIVELPEE